MIPATSKNLEEFVTVSRYFSLVTAAKRSAEQESFAASVGKNQSADSSGQSPISGIVPAVDPTRGNLLDLVA